ncbi:hypothetical protein EPI10_015273 [Gossypium australe]|uniref:Uncharacterized protein n=1 Tax=Gossypium australe TaxID=47621 RepID=A0A5B6VJV5_9ROSI|nr:hypothetical protein EPI10_015273 [Gossypium australe]
MIQNNLQVRGTMTDDANQHLKWVTDDAIRLRLILFSLNDNVFLGTRIKYRMERACGKVFAQILPYYENYPMRKRYFQLQIDGRKELLQSLGAF